MTDWNTLAPLLLLGVVLVSLLLYMVLDGFDLGVGTLALAERDDGRSHEMVESIATVWDGNESWLVLVGSALFAGFPLAYGTVLPALYVPLIVMLLALILRGVSFEFQAQHEDYDRRWGLAFSAGSLLAALSQGLALGGFLHGIPVRNDQFAGGALDFLSPFSVLVSVLVTALYALSGACWLVYKSRGDLLASSRRKGRALAICCAVLLPATLVAAAFRSPVADNAVSGGRLSLVGAAASG